MRALARPLRLALACSLVVVIVASPACSRHREVSETRETLGTSVTVVAYGSDESALRHAVGDAFDEMAAVERRLDAHDPDSAVAAFNSRPYEEQDLPAGAVETLSSVDRLGVEKWYSASLLSVTGLYAFEEGGARPKSGTLRAALREAAAFRREASRGAFRKVKTDPGGDPNPPAPGLDFGGAAKGLALDRAAEALDAEPAVSAGLMTAGSTTVVLGEKPDGEPWRIGIEHPRDPGSVIATVKGGPGLRTVSTSGDYQRYFERDGVRYHHILDPTTGLPAAGIRSLTVVGARSGLDSDVLSTALFVAGRARAERYARDHGLGLYIVDAEGRAHITPAPSKADWSIESARRP